MKNIPQIDIVSMPDTLDLIFMLLLYLKLTGQAELSWWAVFIPVYLIAVRVIINIRKERRERRMKGAK